MSASVSEMMRFVRSEKERERRDFFETWLQNHFKIDDIDTLETFLLEEEAIEKKPDSKHVDELALVRAEYLWCMNEPLEKIRRLGCADANQLTEGKC